MEKRNHFFAILVVAFAVIHSGMAINCYKCSSIHDKHCEDGQNWPEVQCVATPTTTEPPTTIEPTPSPSTEPTPSPSTEPTPSPSTEPTPSPSTEPTPSPSTEPTPSPSTEPTPSPSTEPTPSPPTEPTNSPPTEPTPSPPTEPTPSPSTEPTPSPPTEPTNSPSTDKEKEKEDNDGSNDDKNKNFSKNYLRIRRNIFPNQITNYADEFRCATIRRKENGTDVFERGCLAANACPEGAECEPCETNLCNNANAMSINSKILGHLVLTWAASFIFRNY